MRARTTWNTNQILAQRTAATTRTADPYAMNQDHLKQQPSADKYLTGDPSSFAEDVAAPNWEVEYQGGQVKRNEIGMPEVRPETFNHPEKTASINEDAVLKKAHITVKIARRMFGANAPEALIEDQAASLMLLPDAEVINTYNRLAGEMPPQFEENAKKKQEEAKQQEASQAQEQVKQAALRGDMGALKVAMATLDRLANEQQQAPAQQQQAGQQQQQAQGQQAPAPQQQQAQGQQGQPAPQQQQAQQGQPQTMEGQVQQMIEQAAQQMQMQASRVANDPQQGQPMQQQAQGQQGQQAPAQQQAGQQQAQGQQQGQAPMQQQAAPMQQQAAPQMQQQAAPQAAPQVQQAQQQQGMPVQASDDQLLDQMLMPSQGAPDAGSIAEMDIQMEAPSMDIGDVSYSPGEDEYLRQIFATGDEAMAAQQAQELQGQGQQGQGHQVQASNVRTAALRTVGTRPTAGVARIGGAGSAPTRDQDVNRLSAMWQSAPDVREVFGIK